MRPRWVTLDRILDIFVAVSLVTIAIASVETWYWTRQIADNTLVLAAQRMLGR